MFARIFVTECIFHNSATFWRETPIDYEGPYLVPNEILSVITLPSSSTVKLDSSLVIHCTVSSFTLPTSNLKKSLCYSNNAVNAPHLISTPFLMIPIMLSTPRRQGPLNNPLSTVWCVCWWTCPRAAMPYKESKEVARQKSQSCDAPTIKNVDQLISVDGKTYQSFTTPAKCGAVWVD